MSEAVVFPGPESQKPSLFIPALPCMTVLPLLSDSSLHHFSLLAPPLHVNAFLIITIFQNYFDC